jgi:hypothetical protein
MASVGRLPAGFAPGAFLIRGDLEEAPCLPLVFPADCPIELGAEAATNPTAAASQIALVLILFIPSTTFPCSR